MKINVFKKAFHSFLLVASLTFGCFQLSSCSSSSNDNDSHLTGFEDTWEKVTGLPSSDLGKIELINCSQVEYLPYENKNYSITKKSAYVFSGIKNNKLWISVYEPNVLDKDKEGMDLSVYDKVGYSKVYEWSDSENFNFNKRIDKYTTITINRINCSALVLKKNGFALTMAYEGYKNNKPDSQISSGDDYCSVKLTKFVKNGVVKDSLNFILEDVYQWYCDYFVNQSRMGNGEIINIDGSAPHIYFGNWWKGVEAVAMDETVNYFSLTRNKLLIQPVNYSWEDENSMKIYRIIFYSLIWKIKDEDVAKKLNIKLGEKDKISYELLKKVDEHTWKYKAHVVYDDWDTPDADYEILVDIDKGELK